MHPQPCQVFLSPKLWPQLNTWLLKSTPAGNVFKQVRHSLRLWTPSRWRLRWCLCWNLASQTTQLNWRPLWASRWCRSPVIEKNPFWHMLQVNGKTNSWRWKLFMCFWYSIRVDSISLQYGHGSAPTGGLEEFPLKLPIETFMWEFVPEKVSSSEAWNVPNIWLLARRDLLECKFLETTEFPPERN